MGPWNSWSHGSTWRETWLQSVCGFWDFRGLTLVNGTGNQTSHAFAKNALKRGGERRSGLDGGEGLLANAVVAWWCGGEPNEQTNKCQTNVKQTSAKCQMWCVKQTYKRTSLAPKISHVTTKTNYLENQKWLWIGCTSLVFGFLKCLGTCVECSPNLKR